MRKPLVIVAGANPAWQKTLFFNNFIQGRVNRAAREEEYPSGKGINCCRALRCSDLADMLLFQFAGGKNGELLCKALDQNGFPHETIITESETRNCITCLDPSGNMTELIGVSHAVSQKEADGFIDRLQKKIRQADVLAVTGSLPDGSDLSLYSRMVSTAFAYGVPVVVDAVAGVDGMLKQEGYAVLKVNKEEFFRITGKDEMIQASIFASGEFPGKIFAVTDGADCAYLCDGINLWQYHLPAIEVISPLGAGDTACAVISAMLADKKTQAHEAFKYALAAASANCMSATAGSFELRNAEKIYQKITVAMKKLP